MFQVGLRIGDANRAGLKRGMVGEGFQLPAGRKNRVPGAGELRAPPCGRERCRPDRARRVTMLAGAGFGAGYDLNPQRLKAELRVDVANLQPIGLIEAALESFDSGQFQLRRPAHKARLQIQIHHSPGRWIQQDIQQICQQRITDLECLPEVVAILIERAGGFEQ